MAINRKHRTGPEIEMGSFADIAFLLIIFFILTTSLVKPLGRLIDIPSAESNQPKKEEKGQFTVTLAADKMLFGQDEKNQKETTPENLRRDLLNLNLSKKADNERMIVVNLADGVPYDDFYSVVTAISKAGGIVTLIEEEGDEEAGP